MALEHEDELLFIHTLTTLGTTTTVSLSQNIEGVFLNWVDSDVEYEVLCTRIQDSDAKDLLASMEQVKQMFRKAISLGDKVC